MPVRQFAFKGPPGASLYPDQPGLFRYSLSLKVLQLTVDCDLLEKACAQFQWLHHLWAAPPSHHLVVLQEKLKGPSRAGHGELIVPSFLETANEKGSLEICFSHSGRQLTKRFTHPVLHTSCTILSICWKTRELLQGHEVLWSMCSTSNTAVSKWRGSYLWD